MQVTFVDATTAADLDLCRRFGLPTGPAPAGGHRLQRRDGLLHLSGPTASGDVDFALDLEHGALAHRLRTSRRGEPLPRAIGLGRGTHRLVDATAGLGRDALVLAHLGAEVLAVERIPALAAMLADAASHASLGGRLQVRCGDAGEVLRGLTAEARPDCVYLDPMFESTGSAQVQKPSQLLRALAAPADDLAALFAIAMATARRRVVVKRHPGSAPVDRAPDFAAGSGRVRFDVYLTG